MRASLLAISWQYQKYRFETQEDCPEFWGILAEAVS